ncbi:MAG: hypothetical protein Q4F41_18700 [Eubacteriales bacterium]|nr:hypothetical protein [Eubacteriales bacterium]
MKRLFFFEMKKIFRGKLVWAGILLTLMVTCGGFSDITNVSYEQETDANYEGILDDELVQRLLADFQPTKEQLAQWQVNVAYIGINDLQQAVHRLFANADGSWNGKTVEDVFGEETIQVGYHAGWFDFSKNLVKVTMMLGILTILMVAPVFAGEYGGMDSLLLTARYGRTKCATAKILAAFCAPLLLTVLFLAGNFLVIWQRLGTQGLNSSVLFCGIFYEHYMAFNISCGTMLLYQAGLAVSGIAMLAGMTALISALCGNQVVSLVAAAAVFFGPLMVPVSEMNPLYRIWVLLPVYQVQFSSLMSMEQIKGNLLYAVVAFPVSAGIAVLGAILAKACWKRHQT